MKKNFQEKSDKHADCRGVSAVEVIIVLVLIGLLAAFAIPQLLGARRLMKFTNIEQQLSSTLREARQLAMSERRRVTVQYNDTAKTITAFEVPTPTPAPTPVPTPPLPTPTPTPVPVLTALGPQFDSRNRVVTFTDNGLPASDIIYGPPPTFSLAVTTLGDTSTPTLLVGGVGGTIDITFNPRGDVVIPTTGVIDNNKALFFYENNSKTTFAISILAPGGRIKIWRYNGTTYE